MVNGCSFTEGYSLPNQNLAWPGRLGVLSNQSVINLALGGASNARINRTTLEYLTCNPAPDLVIIGWTHTQRDELSCRQGQYLRLTTENCLVDSKNELPDDLSHIHKFWATELNNDYINFRNWIYYVLHLQDYLETKKIKFLFFLALGENYINEFIKNSDIALHLADKSCQWRDRSRYLPCREIHSQYQELCELVNRINLSNWIFENDCTMNQYLRRKNFSVDQTGHFKEDGHQHWAEVIYDCLL